MRKLFDRILSFISPFMIIPIFLATLLFDEGGTGDGSPAGAGGDNGDENDDDDNDDDDDDDGDPEEQIRNKDARIASLEDANKRLSKKIGRKDKTIEDQKKEIDRLKDSNKPTDQKVTEELDGLKTSVSDLTGRVTDLTLENVILKHEGLSELVPQRRLHIGRIIRPDLEIDEDGDSNVNELVDKLKNDDPDLFKIEKKSGDDDDEGEEKPPRTGRPVRRTKKTKGIDRAAMESRFPVLAKRTRTG